MDAVAAVEPETQGFVAEPGTQQDVAKIDTSSDANKPAAKTKTSRSPMSSMISQESVDMTDQASLAAKRMLHL